MFLFVQRLETRGGSQPDTHTLQTRVREGEAIVRENVHDWPGSLSQHRRLRYTSDLVLLIGLYLFTPQSNLVGEGDLWGRPRGCIRIFGLV